MTKLPEDDFSLTETELRAELARLRQTIESAPAPLNATGISKLTPEQAVFRLTVKALGLQHELRAERDRCDAWRKLANRYEDIRQWLRICEDNPEGWQDFYKQVCLIIFGVYRDDDFADDNAENITPKIG